MSLKDLNTIPRDNDKSMDESEDDNSFGGELGNMAVDCYATTGLPPRPQLGKEPLLHLGSSKYIVMDHYTYVYEDDLEENNIGENSIKAYMADHQGQVAQLDIGTFQNLHSTVLVG